VTSLTYRPSATCLFLSPSSPHHNMRQLPQKGPDEILRQNSIACMLAYRSTESAAFIFSQGHTRLRRDPKQRRASAGALAGTPHSPMPPRVRIVMVILSLLYCLAATPATTPCGPLCLHPRASRLLSSVLHRWIAPTLVWSRGSKGWGRGLPHARPCRCGQRVCRQGAARTKAGPVYGSRYGQRAVPLGCPVLDCPTGAPLEQPRCPHAIPSLALTVSGISLHTL